MGTLILKNRKVSIRTVVFDAKSDDLCTVFVEASVRSDHELEYYYFRTTEPEVELLSIQNEQNIAVSINQEDEYDIRIAVLERYFEMELIESERDAEILDLAWSRQFEAFF